MSLDQIFAFSRAIGKYNSNEHHASWNLSHRAALASTSLVGWSWALLLSLHTFLFDPSLILHSGREHIIQDFMDRCLTQDTDRLIAIAGVAQAIQRHTSDTYVAGLWKRFLPHGLSWHVSHVVDPEVVASNGTNLGLVLEPPPYRNQDPVAPSWSFASVNRPIRFTTSVQDIAMCEVVDTHVQGPPHRQEGKLTIHGDTRTLYVMREKKSVLSEVLKLSKDKHYRYEEDYGLTQGLLRPDSLLLLTTDPPSTWRRQVQTIPGNWYVLLGDACTAPFLFHLTLLM